MNPVIRFCREYKKLVLTPGHSTAGKTFINVNEKAYDLKRISLFCGFYSREKNPCLKWNPFFVVAGSAR